MLRGTLQLFTTMMKAASSQRTVATEDRRLAPSFAEACRFWLKFGFISFGGPTAQIALLHGELVEKKKWISETRFFHALNFCMRSEERRVGKSVDLGGRRIIKKKKKKRVW